MPKYFIWGAIIDEIIFKISIWNCLLLVHKNTDFLCIAFISCETQQL